MIRPGRAARPARPGHLEKRSDEEGRRMAICEHYLACPRHRGRKCEVCGGVLLWVATDLAPDAPRCHPA